MNATQPQLVPYGIQNDTSDIRAHVCFGEGAVYVYKTTDGLAAINTGKYQMRPATQSGVNYATAQGYLVPPMDIPNCQAIPLPDAWKTSLARKVTKNDSPRVKGQWAVRVVQELLKSGKIALSATGVDITDKTEQISGGDLFVSANLRMQVKCDWDGGVNGRTGNLYLQVAERNPFGQH
jgi:hypothetical protein